MYEMFWLTRLEIALFGVERISLKTAERRAKRVKYILRNAENPKKIKLLIRFGDTSEIINDVIAYNTEEGNQALELLVKNGARSRRPLPSSFFFLQGKAFSLRHGVRVWQLERFSDNF